MKDKPKLRLIKSEDFEEIVPPPEEESSWYEYSVNLTGQIEILPGEDVSVFEERYSALLKDPAFVEEIIIILEKRLGICRQG